MRDNLKMKGTIQLLQKGQEAYTKENTMLGDTVKNLRGLTASLLKDVQLSKVSDTKVNRVLQRLDIDNIIYESEPPVD